MSERNKKSITKLKELLAQMSVTVLKKKKKEKEEEEKNSEAIPNPYYKECRDREANQAVRFGTSGTSFWRTAASRSDRRRVPTTSPGKNA